jgi:exopolysaccharide biosynthesis WecB/TagA/CpsF family protein
MTERAPTITWPGKVDLFGVRVTSTTYDEAIPFILEAARNHEPAIIAFLNVHVVVESSRDPTLMEAINAFDMACTDGQPVRWAVRRLYGLHPDRVYGPLMMLKLCARAAEDGLNVYLYGSTPETLERLHRKLEERFVGIEIVGAESPPFRPLTSQEEVEVVERINASGSHFTFIGMGFPKQELFAYRFRDELQSIQLCVGAAFDYIAGTVQEPPQWMQDRSLEWLWRLTREPKRLWRRYLTTNPVFAWKLLRRMTLGR